MNNTRMKSLYKYAATLLVATLTSIPAFANPNTEQKTAQDLSQKIVHILDYIAVEYPDVVKNGVVTNAEEYAEQQEFADQLLLMVSQLPKEANSPVLMKDTKQLSFYIQQKKPADKIVALSSTISLRLIEMSNVAVAPRVAPDLKDAKNLFQNNCSICHGIQGYGDGPRAATLQPHPANFHDKERQQHRSVFSLFNTISLGVDGTAMPSFKHLTSQQRWQLAFYISNFYASDSDRAKGEAFLTETRSRPAIKNLRQLTLATPAQVNADFGDGALTELAYLRANPAEVRTHMINPIKVAEDSLEASLKAYKKGDHKTAYDLAVAAYLEGFELVETPLNSAAPELREEIESAMLQYRDMVRNNSEPEEVQSNNSNILAMLNEASGKLHTNSLSTSVNFLSALLILLREGIEAILILAAISAVLIKTGRTDMLRYLHIGWISALATGGLTWFAASQFINISGANREMTEGITALVSATMLVYVGFWLHKQTYAMHWQHFIRAKVSQSLTNSALTGLAIVAFLAVYREVFESILFFHTLWLQTNSDGHLQIVSGMFTAVALLILIAWGIFKFSVQLPLKLFFRVNSIFLYLLAIVFAGKGVAALQEAGKLRIDPVNFFEIDALGIFPNLESLGIQVAMIAIAIALYFFGRSKMKQERAEIEA